MDLQLHSFDGGAVTGSVAVDETVFGQPYREGLVHQVVTAYFAEVRGGGRKPWKQKGSGQARAGTTRGPLWRTGGRAFAARPRNYEQKVNRKMYRGAIRSILSELIRQDRMKVVDDILVDVVKTKALALRLATHGSGSTLLISNDVSEQLYLSVRNLRQVGLSEVETIDPALLISFDKVLISQAAIQSLQERLS